MEILNLLSTNLIVAQMVCFFLVLLILRKFLWSKGLAMLDQRRDRIAAELKAVEDAKGHVAAIKKDYENHLAKIDEEAQVKFKQIERVAEEKSRETRDKAREDANRIIEDARQEIRFEVLRSREEIKKDVVDMVVKVTGQMIQQKLTVDDDRKIIEKMLTEAKSNDAK